MKVLLMHQARDFDLLPALPPTVEALRRDLELDTLLEAMAGDDAFLMQVAEAALQSSLTDPDAILYRQRILEDSLAHPAVVRELYDVAVEAIGAERKVFVGFLSDSPDTVLRRAVGILDLSASPSRGADSARARRSGPL